LRAEHRLRRDALVRALRQHVPGGQLRFAVPDGGLYLWCQLAPAVRAEAVREAAMRESVVFLTGEPFYVDRGGTHELRLCYTAQPADRAEDGARALARAIATAAREPASLATGA